MRLIDGDKFKEDLLAIATVLREENRIEEAEFVETLAKVVDWQPEVKNTEGEA